MRASLSINVKLYTPEMDIFFSLLSIVEEDSKLRREELLQTVSLLFDLFIYLPVTLTPHRKHRKVKERRAKENFGFYVYFTPNFYLQGRTLVCRDDVVYVFRLMVAKLFFW